MNVKLKPELEKFVDDQVREGKFASATEVVEAGIARLLLDPAPDSLDEEEAKEIAAALDEMRRGDVLDWKTYSAELRQKYLNA